MNFDYNLLKVLAVILETRNTTTAAERLCTSQPAVSRSLRKIRDLFNDDILVRKGTNMELTPKAVFCVLRSTRPLRNGFLPRLLSC